MPSAPSSQAILSAAGARDPKSTTQSVRSHTLNPRDALRASICRVTFQIAAEMQSTVSVSVASLHWAAFETVLSTDSCVSTPFLTIIIMTAAAVYFVQKKSNPMKDAIYFGTCSAAETRDEICGVTHKSDYSFHFPPQRRDYKTPNTYLIELSLAQSPFTKTVA